MKNIIITGGSSGLGKYLVKELSKDNNIIVLSKSSLNKKNKNIESYNCDISNYEVLNDTMNSIIKKYKKIDILINCAGLYINGELEDNDNTDIFNVINTNLVGTIYCCKKVISNMKKNKNGIIININSQLGISSKEERSIYSSSKWGLSGFTKSLQLEASKYNIRVTNLVIGSLNETMKINGVKYKRPKKYIDNSNILSVINYIINIPKDIEITELEIHSINEY